MIDKLVLRCDFRKSYIDFDLEALEIPLQASIDEVGDTHSLRHSWERIPSSFHHLAFKVFFNPSNLKHPDPWIEIKASPALLKQGHNVFGSDDLRESALVLIEGLNNQYPVLFAELDQSSWDVVEQDITYHSRAPSQEEAEVFLKYLSNVSNGQTKSRTGYSTTAYFGKRNSRRKKLKVYTKYNQTLVKVDEEERRFNKKLPNKLDVYTDELINWSKGQIRWEGTLKKRWFQDRGIPTKLIDMVKIHDAKSYWIESFKDIFKAFEGKEMKITNDKQIKIKLEEKYFTISSKTNKKSYGAAKAAYRTYRALKADGWDEVFSNMTSSFYRHISMLTSIGLSKAYLQNLSGGELGCNVIPLIRYTYVDFESQFPEWLNTAVN